MSDTIVDKTAHIHIYRKSQQRRLLIREWTVLGILAIVVVYVAYRELGVLRTLQDILLPQIKDIRKSHKITDSKQ